MSNNNEFKQTSSLRNVYTIMGFNFIGNTTKVYNKTEGIVPRCMKVKTFWFLFIPVFQQVKIY